MSALDVALDCIGRGRSPVPLQARKKKPTQENWQALRITEKDAAEYFSGDQNVGVLLGEPSGWLIDVDIDSRVALAMAPVFLPPTAASFGRTSNPNSHWLYHSEGTETKKFEVPDRLVSGGEKAMIVEIRSTGTQTVFPGSTHPEGELIEWVSDAEPTTIDPLTLYARVARLASAALLARVWVEGQRDILAAALTGVLRRVWTDEDVGSFVGAIAEAAGDEETKQRKRKATRKRRNREYGWPTLREILGDDVVDRVAEWLGLGNNSAVDELNREYAVAPVGGKVVILHQREDREYPGTMTVEYWRQQDFNLKFANRTVQVGEAAVPLSQLWIKSPHRREYKGVVFEPGSAGVEGYYNLWTKWAVEPRKGSWNLLRTHIYENVADGDERVGDWLIGFMADAVQHSNRPAGVSVVLQGDQGVGKGVVWNAFGHLFGRHYIQVNDPRHLVGNFNAHLADKLLIFVDEGFFAGNRQHASVLKGMITEPRVMIEPKGVNAFSIPNYRRVVFASNEDWVVPAGLDERRFAVFRVNPRKQQNRAYFGKLIAELIDGGYAALMHDLTTFDLSRVDVAVIPKTAALFEQKKRTFDVATDFWFQCLIDEMAVLGPGRWGEPVSIRELVQVFLKTVSNPHERKSCEVRLGSAIHRLCPSCRVVRTKKAGIRERVYCFPALDQCRAEFEHEVGYKINWSTGEALDP